MLMFLFGYAVGLVTGWLIMTVISVQLIQRRQTALNAAKMAVKQAEQRIKQ